MKKISLVALLCLVASYAFASDFPGDWKKWKSVNSTLVKIGALPGCEADVSSLPAIYRETVATYCAVKPGGPGKVNVLVNPSAVPTYQKRTGKFNDGPQLILHLVDLKVLFVTSYKKQLPRYTVYTEDGKNITAKTGPLSASVCIECHTGYSAYCLNGQCGP